ncbi:MAG TPA: hypothetical protein VIK98_08985 [Limnochordales bacterium]
MRLALTLTGDAQLLAYHGTPRSAWEYLLTTTPLEELCAEDGFLDVSPRRVK